MKLKLPPAPSLPKPAFRPASYAHANIESASTQVRVLLNREFGIARSVVIGTYEVEREREEQLRQLLALLGLAFESAVAPLLHDAEILETTALLKRLQLLGLSDPSGLQEHCAKRRQDGDRHAHYADPFQRRHILTFCGEMEASEELIRLLPALEEALVGDQPELIAQWFSRLEVLRIEVPRTLPSYLRSYLLAFAKTGSSATRALAYHLAILDVKTLGPIGWENTRSFYAILKRIFGVRCDYLNDYLTQEELQECVQLYQSLGDTTTLEHFEFLFTSFSPLLLASLKDRILNASTRPVELPAELHVRREPSRKDGAGWRQWLRPTGWLRSPQGS